MFLCEQIISIAEYRAQLYDYLKNRMQAIAPNLTVMVGELVGARLIAHAGSLMNLAKHPASTVQILGAEKALFRALKTKHDTPKYGLIYHASLIGQVRRAQRRAPLTARTRRPRTRRPPRSSRARSRECSPPRRRCRSAWTPSATRTRRRSAQRRACVPLPGPRS